MRSTKSETLLKREAVADKEFIGFLDGLSLARKEYLIADAEWKVEQAKLEVMRSLNAMARTKIEHNIITN